MGGTGASRARMGRRDAQKVRKSERASVVNWTGGVREMTKEFMIFFPFPISLEFSESYVTIFCGTIVIL